MFLMSKSTAKVAKGYQQAGMAAYNIHHPAARPIFAEAATQTGIRVNP